MTTSTQRRPAGARDRIPAQRTGPPRARSAAFVSIRANLLPEEILTRRKIARLREYVAIALVVVVLVLGGWYWHASQQTARAGGHLADARHQSALIGEQQKGFASVAGTQRATSLIYEALGVLMSDNVRWASALSALRATAGDTVRLTGVTATAGAGSGGALSAMGNSGIESIGRVTVTGSVPDKNTLAAFLDALDAAAQFTSPTLVGVSGTGNDLAFSVDVLMTPEVLDRRFDGQFEGGR